MPRDRQLTQRAAGVIADERHVFELEALEQLRDQPRKTGRTEVGVARHRQPVRAERQLGHDHADVLAERRHDPIPDAAVDEQTVDQHDRGACALVAITDGPLRNLDLRHVTSTSTVVLRTECTHLHIQTV